MSLDKLVELFEGADGEKHDLVVSLADVREWVADNKRLQAENERLRAKEIRRGHIETVINALNAKIKELEVAARAFESGLSTDCDGPERDALRAALERKT